MKKIALFQHHPECSRQCCDGIVRALSQSYNINIFYNHDDIKDVLNEADAVCFPGGIGDSDSYHDFFTRRNANAVADFLSSGGRYIGICMGAYWAGSRYFDLLDNLDVVQYIKRSSAEIKRSYGTVAEVEWLGEKEKMFFYDGCTFTGTGYYDTIAKYANDEPMAIIQNRIGLIGCHPESEEFWYEKPYQYINKHWHRGRHHQLLLEFVDKLWRVG